jgi:hypothetical protein
VQDGFINGQTYQPDLTATCWARDLKRVSVPRNDGAKEISGYSSGVYQLDTYPNGDRPRVLETRLTAAGRYLQVPSIRQPPVENTHRPFNRRDAALISFIEDALKWAKRREQLVGVDLQNPVDVVA